MGVRVDVKATLGGRVQGGDQGRYVRRSEVFVTIQKKLRGGVKSGEGRVGGSG